MKFRENNMFLIKDFMEIVNYRISEGSVYGWGCYGSNAYMLDSWSGDNDGGHSVGIVFDTKDQLVYEATVCDYLNQRAYRWLNPDFKDAYDLEARSHGPRAKQAWDDIDYITLEVVDDFIDKAVAIVEGTPYDTSVKIPLELDDDEIFQLMKLAHEQDITLNQLVAKILTNSINPEHDSYSEF